MAPHTRQQKRLSLLEGIRMTRAKARITKEYRFSSSSSNSSKCRCRHATTKKKQSPPPPPNKDDESKVADHNNSKDESYSSLLKKKNLCRGPCNCYKKLFPPVPEELGLKYSAQIDESDGFDVDNSLCDYGSTGRIMPIEYEPGFSIEDDKDLAKYARKALTHFKKCNQDAKKLQLGTVVKATECSGRYWSFYITFEAGNPPIKKTLQSHVSVDFTLKDKDGIKIEFCRLKLTPTLTSAPS